MKMLFSIAISLHAIKPVEKVFSVSGSRKATDALKSQEPSANANKAEEKRAFIHNAQDNSLYFRSGYFEAQDDPIKTPHTKGKDKKISLSRGDILYARINSDITSYEGSISPVRAVVTDGAFRNSFLIGNSTLDTKSKTISIRFDTLRPAGSDQIYPVEAYVQSRNGNMGLVGEIDSNYWTYFWAELISSGVSGYASSARETESSIFGTRSKVTPENSGKAAVAEAAAATAEIFRERSKSSAEIAQAVGPHEVQVFIIKAPDDY